MSTAVVRSPTWVTITRRAVNGESPLISSATAHSSAAKTIASTGGSRTVRMRVTLHPPLCSFAFAPLRRARGPFEARPARVGSGHRGAQLLGGHGGRVGVGDEPSPQHHLD